MPRFKNELAAAQDAVLEFGGVTIRRKKNNGLDDIVKGLTLNLLAAKDANVQITVRVDTKKAIAAIEDFLKQYNDFLKLTEKLQIQKIEKDLGNYRRQKQETGLLAGDSTLNRLVMDLKMMTSSGYPSSAKTPIKVFFQMGISTGKVGGSFENSKKGLLRIIEPAKLEKQLLENYDAVKEFFASDTNGDKKMNNGLAFRMQNYLRNYTQSGNYGLITVKIQLAKDRIKMAKKSIAKTERHVANYRARLKRSFQAMESGLMRSNSEKRWLQNQMGNMGGNDNKKGHVR